MSNPMNTPTSHPRTSGEAAMTDLSTELGRKMRELADTGHPLAEELRAKADAFDEAAKGYYSEEPTVTAPKFLGCFARARRLWCDCTGEPLI